MDLIKVPRSRKIEIPSLHTYLIKQFDIICDEFRINLLSGSAQINGRQLKNNYPHTYLLPLSITVFSWQGCMIEVEWLQAQNVRNSQDEWCDLTENNSHQSTPMIKYLEIHYDLTSARRIALQQLQIGPRLAIIGADNTGIQNVSSVLLNYAGKLNMKPIFVDLDLDNSLFIDGSIGAIVYEYSKGNDLFQRTDKLTYFYGNRKVRKQSFLKQVKVLATAVKKKLDKQIKSYIDKGTSDEYPTFCGGLVLQCPKVKSKQDKKVQKEIIAELLKIFQITHAIIIENAQLSAYISKSIEVEKFNTMKLEGTESYLQLPKPVRSKKQRYFDKKLGYCKPISLKINQIQLYQLIQSQNDKLNCRLVNVLEEQIAKSMIAVVYAKHESHLDRYELADRVLSSAICCLAEIDRVENGQISLNVANENFWQQCKDRIWVSTITQINN